MGDTHQNPPVVPRKPGKQQGAQGFGRQQSIKVTAETHHYPTQCAICDGDLASPSATAYTAFETLDIIWGQSKQPGIQLTNSRIAD